jgi:glycosyltransferase involved in cell wall biosynthesis
MRVMVAMLGARRRYLVPEVMEELGVLTRFVTDIYLGKQAWLRTVAGWLGRRLRIRGLRSFAERASARIPSRRVVAFQWLGIGYAIAARFVRAGDVRLFASVNRQFCIRAVPHLRDVDICWAYNGAALELFESARTRDIRCVLEQVIAPRDVELCELEEAEKDWPDWRPADDLLRSIDPLSQREQAEWRLADAIVTGSRYVYAGLDKAGFANRCTILPSAIDLDRFKVGSEVRVSGPLRVLFVGQINLRKGVPYLLEAVRRLNSAQIQLKLIGPLQVSRDRVSIFSQWAALAGPVPLSEIVSQYQWADIVVVPSVCEGSAMVTYEARGCGVPIVATPNAGAFFSPGIDGLEIPVRNVEAIANTLDRLAGDRDEVRSLHQGAIANRHLLGRDAYRERIRKVLDRISANSLSGQDAKPAAQPPTRHSKCRI